MPKVSLYIFLILIISISALADLKEDRESLIREYDYLISRIKSSPNLNFDKDFRDLGYYILSYESLKNLSNKDGSHNEETIKKSAEILIDHRNDQCNRDQSKIFCDDYIEKLKEYKLKYKTDYVPVTPLYPKINLESYSYILADGRAFDIKNNVQINKPLTGQDFSQNENIKPAEEVFENQSVAQSVECEWLPGLPRKILSGRGCLGTICSAAVVCKKNGILIKRMATCSSHLCGENQASECAAQKGYNSYAVNFKSTYSNPVKKTNSNQKTTK